MTTTFSGSKHGGPAARAGSEGGRAVTPGLDSLRGRISVPRLVLGILLVLAAVAAFTAITWLRDGTRDVLALTRQVPVGHVLTGADLRKVAVEVDPGVATIPAESAEAVLGRRMAYSLPAGSLLGPESFGSPAVPAAGQAVAALALKPGQFPPRLSPGAHVLAVRTPTTASTGTERSADPADGESSNGKTVAWTAVVLDVSSAQPGEPATVVSILVSRSDAAEIATAAEQVSLLEVKGD